MGIVMPNFDEWKSIKEWLDTITDEEIQTWKSKDFANILYQMYKILNNPSTIKEAQKYYRQQTKKEIKKIEEEIECLQKQIKKAVKKKDYSRAAHELTREIINKEKEKKEKIKSIEFKSKQIKTSLLDEEVKDDPLMRINYLTVKYQEIFEKLYMNYRLAPEIMNYMVKIGREIGQRLATTHDIDTSVLALNIGKRKGYAEQISNIVFSYCFPLRLSEEINKERHKISVEKMKSHGNTTSDKISISDRIADYFLRTIAHEAIHAYGQTCKQLGEKLFFEHHFLPEGYKNKGGKEKQEVEDFFKVLRWNVNWFYVSSHFSDNVKRSDVDEKKRRKINKKQPAERHTRFIATIIEHTYRQATGQYSERNTLDLYKYTKSFLGEPLETVHNGQSVTHKYKATNKLCIERVQDVFAMIDPLFRKDMNIRLEEIKEVDGKVNKYILYDVPETWAARVKVLDFCKKMKSEEGERAKAYIIARHNARTIAKNR